MTKKIHDNSMGQSERNSELNEPIPDRMRTLIVKEDGELEVKEVPIPGYGPKQALVKMISCGICNGTDAKLIHGKFKGYTSDMYPVMLGHEGVGRVVETGAEVKGLKTGDIVLLPFVYADETRYGSCSSGWGAFSEYGVVYDRTAYSKEEEIPDCAWAQTVLPDGIDPVDAAMIVTFREVLSALKRFGIQQEHKVVVFGCGPVGRTFLKFLSLSGTTEVIAFDVTDEKAEAALECGAKYAFNSRKTDVEKTVWEVFTEGADYVLDAAGIPEIMNQAMCLIRDGGYICCYGIAPVTRHELDWSRAPYNWNLCFQQFPSKKEEGAVTDTILQWIGEGKLDLKGYISDYFQFQEILSAFRKLERREITGKGIVIF